MFPFGANMLQANAASTCAACFGCFAGEMSLAYAFSALSWRLHAVNTKCILESMLVTDRHAVQALHGQLALHD